MKSTISKQIAIPFCSSQLTKISAPTNRSGTSYLHFVRKIVIAHQTIHLCIIHSRNADIKFKRSSPRRIWTFSDWSVMIYYIHYIRSLYLLLLYSFRLFASYFVLVVSHLNCILSLYNLCNNTSSSTKRIFTRPISCQSRMGIQFDVGNK